MTPTQRATAERLIDVLDRNQYDAVTASAMGEAADLLRELAAEPVQEPVAALHDDGHFSWKSDEARRQFDSKHEYMGWSMDVYAASPQQRRPLTEDFINDLGFQCGLQREDARNPGVEEFARAVEEAQGITGEPT
jgi:hypothetical protein